MMAGLGLGFGIIISSLTTKYRDLPLLVTFGSIPVDVCHAGYLSGVVHFPKDFRWVIQANR